MDDGCNSERPFEHSNSARSASPGSHFGTNARSHCGELPIVAGGNYLIQNGIGGPDHACNQHESGPPASIPTAQVRRPLSHNQ